MENTIQRSKETHGFTLIELQVVVAIIGLLAAMAIPAFQEVRKNTLRLEGTSLASGIRHDIQDFYEYTGRFPFDNEECGLPLPDLIQGKYVSRIEIRDGVIRVDFKKRPIELEGVLFRPVVNKENPTGPIRWEKE